MKQEATKNNRIRQSIFNYQNSFCFYNTDKFEIKKVIVEIKNKKSSGDDDISAEVLLKLPDKALEALSNCINQSWQQGVFSFLPKIFNGGTSLQGR